MRPDQNEQFQVILRFPVKGLVQGAPYEDQPELTTSDCLNVMPFDGAQDRARGGQRPGFHQEQTLSGVSGQVHALGQTSYTTGSAVQMAIYCACDNDIFVHSAPQNLALATNGNNALAGSTSFATAASILNKVYFCAGQTNIQVLNLANSTVAAISATAGTAPTGGAICCNWRSRLVVSGCASDPQNVFMSRAGDPTDWDYGENDELAAVAMNNSTTTGVVGDPVRAVIPFSNDILIIGTDNDIFALEGDPAAGGVLSTVSTGVGILSQQAWAISPEGDLYFFGFGGFYKLARGGGAIQNLSAGRVDNFFSKSYSSSVRTICCWDPNMRGCWIFRTGDAEGTHLWYDQRADGFFLMQFPTALGPASAMFYDDFGPSTPALRMGGMDGKVYRFDELEEDDAGTVIQTRCVIGPFRPGGAGESRLIALEFYTGDYGNMDASDGIRMDWTVTTDKQAQAVPGSATNRKIKRSITTTGRQITCRAKISGGTFFLTLGNANVTDDSYWSFERAVATFVRGGRQR